MKSKQTIQEQIGEVLETYNSTHRLGNDEKYFNEATQALLTIFKDYVEEARIETRLTDWENFKTLMGQFSAPQLILVIDKTISKLNEELKK